MKIAHNRYLFYLTVLFAIWWIVLAIAPTYRQDWALENVFVAAGIMFIAATYKKIPFSRISYTLIFLFLCLHVLGAHYTYAETPYDAWSQHLFGFSLNELMGFQRNHYDRFIHFAYGFLLAYPIRELFIRVASVKGFWGYFLPVVLTMASSMTFELFEWAAALVFGGDLGIAYLGTQGDVWDAQKDMALASFGAIIAMTVTASVNINLQRDFAKEWNESLKVKGTQPLGEDKLIKMWKSRKQ